ncbi:MAG: MaoC family dehydratase [Nannocystales bacterium]
MTDTVPLRVQGIDGLRAIVGQRLGPSAAVRVDAAKVRAFADATGDHQWIHVDAERAAAEAPWGGPIAHGYLVLSLLPVLLFQQVLVVEDVSAMINYGLDKLRFPAVTPVGAEVRLQAVLESLEPKAGGQLGRFSLSFEVEGVAKPVCAATALILFT